MGKLCSIGVRLRLSKLVLLTVAAAACKSELNGAGTTVIVTTDPGVKADCIGIAAKAATGPEEKSNLVARKDELEFGVAADDQLIGDITVVARGFVGPNCSILNAESAPAKGTLTKGVVAGTVNLELKGALADSDGDGYRSKADGGTDCDDGNPDINPGELELCGDGIDNDCSGAADCMDRAACDGHSCDDGNACTTGDTCTGGACLGATMPCGAPPSSCYQTPGTCTDAGTCAYTVVTGAPCDAGTCRSDGVCAGGETICDDGVDNDNNGFTDCADPSCLNQHCSDGDACTSSDVCRGDGGCAGTALACNTPPVGQCFVQDAGTCAAGACLYATAMGAACDDGQPCTANDACLADAGCAGVAKTCTAASDGGCGATSGTCNTTNGQCQFGTAPAGTACDDLMSCTVMDQCNAAGVCAGTGVTCAAQQCKTTAGCLADGGCNYTNAAPGTPCDGGMCTGGVCSAFPYTPSNFDPGSIASTEWSGAIHIMGPCTLTFDSTGLTFTQTCGINGLPAAKTVTLSDGTQAALLPFGGLQIDMPSGFTLTGTRPVILAVKNDASIAGLVNVSSNYTQVGAGANASTACGAGTGTNGQQRVNGGAKCGGGGGGGGFGSAGTNGGQASFGGPSNGTGGQTNGTNTLIPLRGGCAGGVGGANAAGGVCTAGDSGGAIQISVAGTLTVTGSIAASASGGPGGPSSTAGGGGGGCGAGSGGAILLEGNVVTLSGAELLTNGGGGGEGGGTNNGSNDGTAGSISMPVPATGGDGATTFGGAGGTGAAGQVGTGSFVAAGAAADGNTEGGGGGGGGGVGRIRVNASATCMVSGVSSSGAVSFTATCP
jgi:hypothetical protein